jgi:type IV pilus assembly protein PilN
MIRINLTQSERRVSKTAGRPMQVGQKMTVVGSFILIVTLLLIGWRYFSIRNEQAQLERDIDAAKREEQRLSEVLKQLASLEATRAQLEQRETLINELRKGQNAPAHMVDQVSRALPDMMWLTTMKQDGFDVTIEGRTLQLTALSDFVGNLEASHYFKRPVEIIESAVTPGQQNAPELIRFVIKGTFQMAGSRRPASAKPAGRGGN